MIDLHTHSTFSDGLLGPAHLARRAKVAGYRALAITDHVDVSTMDLVVPRILALAKEYSIYMDLTIIPGVELTHVPAALLASAVERVRSLGPVLVLVHGETLADVVEKGTNLAAIEAGVDILAHPGLITDEDTSLAAERGVLLEISTRPGHGLANGHIVQQARCFGAGLVVNNDVHGPRDFLDRETQRAIARGAGLTAKEYAQTQEQAWTLASRFFKL